MKKVLFGIICLFSSLSLNAQQTQETVTATNQGEKIHLGIGIGFGFFYPGEVNEYIENELSNYMLNYGFSDIVMLYSFKATLCFDISELLDLAITGDYSLAPKFILVDNGDNMNFFFNKFSPGITPKFYFPMGTKGRNSIFIAPGLLYNFMTFEDFSAKGVGAKLEAGFSLKVGKTKMQPFAAYEHSKATDNDAGNNFELNYSNFKIGIDFIF